MSAPRKSRADDTFTIGHVSTGRWSYTEYGRGELPAELGEACLRLGREGIRVTREDDGVVFTADGYDVVYDDNGRALCNGHLTHFGFDL